MKDAPEERTPNPARPISRIGLVAGPGVALMIYLLLPAQHLDAAGKATAFTHAGRGTLAVFGTTVFLWLTRPWRPQSACRGNRG